MSVLLSGEALSFSPVKATSNLRSRSSGHAQKSPKQQQAQQQQQQARLIQLTDRNG